MELRQSLQQGSGTAAAIALVQQQVSTAPTRGTAARCLLLGEQVKCGKKGHTKLVLLRHWALRLGGEKILNAPVLGFQSFWQGSEESQHAGTDGPWRSPPRDPPEEQTK